MQVIHITSTMAYRSLHITKQPDIIKALKFEQLVTCTAEDCNTVVEAMTLIGIEIFTTACD